MAKDEASKKPYEEPTLSVVELPEWLHADRREASALGL